MNSTKLKIVALGNIDHGHGVQSIPHITDYSRLWWCNEFDFEPYDSSTRYDSKKHIFWIDQYDKSSWADSFIEQGYKVIRNHLWDSAVDQTSEIIDRTLYLRARDWIWIHEYILWKYKEYDAITVDRNPDSFMLLLMNLIRPHRDFLLDKCSRYLDSSLYSYVERGIKIEGDVYFPHPCHNGTGNDRYYNPQWYRSTNFSLVSETTVNPRLFISEKSFKPLAFKHPFIINGTPGTLTYLRNLGFETFGHVIDESYDIEPNINTQSGLHFWVQNGSNINRLNKIMSVVDQLYREFKTGYVLFADTESIKKIAHNHNRFFNRALVNQLWQEQIVQVINNFGHL